MKNFTSSTEFSTAPLLSSEGIVPSNDVSGFVIPLPAVREDIDRLIEQIDLGWLLFQALKPLERLGPNLGPFVRPTLEELKRDEGF